MLRFYESDNTFVPAHFLRASWVILDKFKVFLIPKIGASRSADPDFRKMDEL
jgi:hypothetical protein